MSNTEISEIMKNINAAWGLLNPRYKDSFEVSLSDDGYCVFIPTKWKMNFQKSKASKIKEIFSAKEVSFIDIEVEKEQKNSFWSIRLTGKKDS